jgi:hypothetical protein
MPLRPGRVVEKNRPNVRDTAIWQNVHGLEIPWPNVERRDVTTGEPPRHTCSGTLMMMQCRGGFASGLSTGTSKDYPRRCSCKSFRATFLRRGSLFASIQQSCASHRDVGFFVHQNANPVFSYYPLQCCSKRWCSLLYRAPSRSARPLGHRTRSTVTVAKHGHDVCIYVLPARKGELLRSNHKGSNVIIHTFSSCCCFLLSFLPCTHGRIAT